MTDYTVWLEEHSSKLAREAGTYRGLLGIALTTMKLSPDPFVVDEADWIEARLKMMEEDK